MAIFSRKDRRLPLGPYQGIMSIAPSLNKAAILACALARSAMADDSISPPPVTSPNGQFQAHIIKVGETHTSRVEIRSKDGNLVYTSPPQIDGTDVIEFYPQHLRWNAESKILAAAGGYPKHIRTYLFTWDGSRFEAIKMPALAAGYDNPSIIPAAWTSPRQLSLKISGPYAGKTQSHHYSGTAEIQIDVSRKAARTIQETIK
jgi:hypothetical protein